MKRLNKKMNYNSGVFNRKSDIEVCKALNLCFAKIDELVDENNNLRKEVNELKENAAK